MNPDRKSIIAFRINPIHKKALQTYCKHKGICEADYCRDKLQPYLDLLVSVNSSYHSGDDACES